MALIKCSECGKKISDTASSCPNCGYKKRNDYKPMTKIDKIFVPIIALLVIGGFTCICVSGEFVKYTYPNMEFKYSNYYKGTIGYYDDGSPIIGLKRDRTVNLGNLKADYSMTILAISLSIIIPAGVIVAYKKLKKKENQVTN